MLVVNNGTFKSGSSWLGAIIRRLKPLDPPPPQFLDKTWRNPHIPAHLVGSFLRDCDIARNDYYIKSHYASKTTRDILINASDVRLVLISRNLHDVVVSAYFHFQRTRKLKDSFADYFWVRGRLVASSVLRYNQLWHIQSPRTFRTTYEMLKERPHEQLELLSNFLGVPNDSDQIQRVIDETRFEKMKARDQSGFIRAGKSNAYGDYMTADMIQELTRIESRGGLRSTTHLLLHMQAKATDTLRRFARR